MSNNPAGCKASAEYVCEWLDCPLHGEDMKGIIDCHPMTSRRFDLHAEAMRLVGERHAKGDLVDLVNWLLHRIENAKPQLYEPLSRKSGCSDWCALKQGRGTTCDCDWFEKEGRGFGEGPKGYRAVVVKWPLSC